MAEWTWHGGLDSANAAAVRALVAAAAAADEVAPVSEQVLLDLGTDDPAVRHLVVGDGDGAGGDAGGVIAFARLDTSDPTGGASAELVVHPDHRRRGLGTRVLHHVLAAAPPSPSSSSSAAPSSDGPDAAVRLRVWGHGDLPAARALAARAGFRVARTLWRMRRDLTEPLPAPALPDGVRLRPFVVGADEERFLAVNNAAFAEHPEQGRWDLDEVRHREGESWFDPAGFLLAVDAQDEILGFHWTKVHPDGPGGAGGDPIGEVYVLGVAPSAQGRRLGPALTLAGLAHLRAAGLDAVMLYVEGDNAAAVRLYTGLGFTQWGVDVSYVR